MKFFDHLPRIFLFSLSLSNMYYEGMTYFVTSNQFENWKLENWIESEYIDSNFIDNIKNEIENIEFYDSQSKIWNKSILHNAFVYIKKK